MWVSVLISVGRNLGCKAGRPASLTPELDVVIVSNIINVINFKLCIEVLLPVYAPFINLYHNWRSWQYQTALTEYFIFFAD